MPQSRAWQIRDEKEESEYSTTIHQAIEILDILTLTPFSAKNPTQLSCILILEHWRRLFHGTLIRGDTSKDQNESRVNQKS